MTSHIRDGRYAKLENYIKSGLFRQNNYTNKQRSFPFRNGVYRIIVRSMVNQQQVTMFIPFNDIENHRLKFNITKEDITDNKVPVIFEYGNTSLLFVFRNDELK